MYICTRNQCPRIVFRVKIKRIFVGRTFGKNYYAKAIDHEGWPEGHWLTHEILPWWTLWSWFLVVCHTLSCLPTVQISSLMFYPYIFIFLSILSIRKIAKKSAKRCKAIAVQNHIKNFHVSIFLKEEFHHVNCRNCTLERMKNNNNVFELKCYNFLHNCNPILFLQHFNFSCKLTKILYTHSIQII